MFVTLNGNGNRGHADVSQVRERRYYCVFRVWRATTCVKVLFACENLVEMGGTQTKEDNRDRVDHVAVSIRPSATSEQTHEDHLVLSSVTLALVVLVILLVAAKLMFDKCVTTIVKGLRRQQALDSPTQI